MLGRHGCARRASVATALVLVTGCGSTVQWQASDLRSGESGAPSAVDTQPSGGAGGPVGGPAGSASGAPQRSASGAPQRSAAGTPAGSFRPGDSPTGSAPSTTGGGATPPPGGGPRTFAPGVSATQILVGVIREKNAYRTSGTPAEEPPPGNGTLIDNVNARGGIGGRKLVPIFYEYDGNDQTRNNSQLEQEECVKFTQDNRVFAVFAPPQPSEILTKCLAKAKVIMIGGAISVVDAASFRINPYLVLSSGVDLTHQAKPYVDGLVAQGVLPKAAKIGLLTFDTPSHTRMINDAFKPALAAQGLKLTDLAQVTYPVTAAEVSDMGRQISSAVLTFRSDNIDRVLIMDVSGVATLAFMAAAEGQQYRPIYGLNSQSGPGQLAKGGPNGGALAPVAQLKGSRTVGWFPLTDINEGRVTPPGLPSCLKELGQESATSENRHFAGESCTSNRLFVAAATAAGSNLTANTFMAALERMQGGFAGGTNTYRSTFGPGKHYAATVVRYGRFADECGCYRYANNAEGQIGQ